MNQNEMHQTLWNTIIVCISLLISEIKLKNKIEDINQLQWQNCLMQPMYANIQMQYCVRNKRLILKLFSKSDHNMTVEVINVRMKKKKNNKNTPLEETGAQQGKIFLLVK